MTIGQLDCMIKNSTHRISATKLMNQVCINEPGYRSVLSKMCISS